MSRWFVGSSRIRKFASESISFASDTLPFSPPLNEWITWNNDVKEGTFVSVPARLQIPENIKEQLIVELYNK